MKRKSKKLWSLVLLVILTVGGLGGCGAKKQKIAEDGQPVITLALRSGIYADVIRQCVTKFEEEKHVHCEILELGEEELHQLLVNDARYTNGRYDLCMVDSSWMAEYIHEGILTNLTPYGFRLDTDIIPAAREVCFYDGGTYLAPYYGNVTVLLYNKSIVKKAGYDASGINSMADILEICQKAKEDGNYGFMYRGDSMNNYVVDFLPILLSFGGWVVDEENRPAVDTPEFREAMDFYLELIKTGKAESRDNLVISVANGAAAMGIGWPGWYTPDQNSTADYCALEGKVREESVAYNANVYGIWGIGVPDNSTQKDLAVELLFYLMNKWVQKETVFYGGVPCRYSCLTDEEVLKVYPQYETVCKALENGVYRPVMVEWPDFYSILGEEMEEIIQGQKSTEQGLKDAQKRLNILFWGE